MPDGDRVQSKERLFALQKPFQDLPCFVRGEQKSKLSNCITSFRAVKGFIFYYFQHLTTVIR